MYVLAVAAKGLLVMMTKMKMTGMKMKARRKAATNNADNGFIGYQA